MNSEIELRLIAMRESYKEYSYKQILNLKWISEQPIEINGKTYHPAIWGEEFQDQALLVVQLTRWHFLKIYGTTDCIGFLLSQDGVLTEVDAYWLMHEVGHP